jgi:hypothetical protein
MTTSGPYATEAAFRQALEDRLNAQASSQGLDIARLRRSVAFERLLSRLFILPNPPWLLKGGYAIELRLRAEARSTKDLDLALTDNSIAITAGEADWERVRDRLQAAVDTAPDWFTFRIGQATGELVGAPLKGARYPVECRLDVRLFVNFHLDVSAGDYVPKEPEWIEGNSLLDFAGIPPARVALVPSAQQFAEKVHAYTRPRKHGDNSRVRDLVDMALLIRAGLVDRQEISEAINKTFLTYGTHPVPDSLAPPPEEWQSVYDDIVRTMQLPLPDINGAFKLLDEYWRSLS